MIPAQHKDKKEGKGGVEMRSLQRKEEERGLKVNPPKADWSVLS